MGDIQGMNTNVVKQESMVEACTNHGKLSLVSRSFESPANPKERLLPTDLIISPRIVSKDTPHVFLTHNKHFWLDKLSWNKCFLILPPPLSSQTPEFSDAVNRENNKMISTSMLTPVTVDTANILFDLTRSLCFNEFRDQPLEVCIRTDHGCESQNRIVYIHITPIYRYYLTNPSSLLDSCYSCNSLALSLNISRSTIVLKSLLPCWLSSHNTIHIHVDLMDLLGMNILPQELIEEIVSHTSPLDSCGKLSIVFRSFWSAAKSDDAWERFLPAELLVLDQWMYFDPWKKIDSDTLQAFPTKKDLYLFLSDNPLIIDDGAMYFWLDKLNGNKCFCILSPSALKTEVLKSLSPRWLSSHNTIDTHVNLLGDVLGMNALPQELIEEIVSRTSPLDACGKLSLVSRRLCSAAKSDCVWERFLPADIISRRALCDSHYWMFFDDPWKKIDSDTLHTFPTKKDLYLFLSDNPLIIDDGDMYLWLDKLSGKKCFHIVPDKLSIPEPDGYTEEYSYIQSNSPFEIYGKISTSLLSPNTAYTAYLVFDFTSLLYFTGFGEEQPLETCVWIDDGCKSENRIVYIPCMPNIYGSFRGDYVGHRPDMPAPPYPEWRDDGWYEVELGDYFNKEGSDNRELHMSFSEVKSGMEKGGIALKGIQIRPKSCKKKQLSP